MSRELRSLHEDQKNSLAFGGTTATATSSRRAGGYSESVKENMKILPSSSSPSVVAVVKNKAPEGDDMDDDDDIYVPLVEKKTSPRHHHNRYRDENHDRSSRRHEDRLSSPPPAPVGRRTTRNSSTTSPLEDSKKECRIVLTSSRRNNIPSRKVNGLDSEDDSQSETEVDSDDDKEMKAKKKKSPYRSSPKPAEVENGHMDDEETDDVDYNGEDEVVDEDETDDASHGEDSSTDDNETYKILRSSRAASLTYSDKDDGRRRSTRPRHIIRGTYHDSTLSWVVGGGGEAKGYFRPSSLTRASARRLVVSSRPSSANVGGNTNGNVVGTRSRSQETIAIVQEELEVSSAEENGHVVATDDNDTNDDMYSRVKKRRVMTRNRSKSSSVGVGKKKSSQIEEEPVCRRLRDRNKLSRNSGNLYESEAQLDKILRKNRRHKRRRGEKLSNSSSSSSSSTDSDDTQIKSPSKKKRKFGVPSGGEGVDNLLRGHGLVAKKELKMLMEVQPVAVDPSITFKSVGGLDTFIDKLKEIVLFPLLYHEFYEGRGMSAPKGILLHGPPGTGKTLLARALSNECANINGRKVSFFLRKGADLLNKFVGESERQLRMLFQQAALHQPSIIFFDEIDGLAPVRSAKSDQIHNSIVSSLLAEIDGLQDRGQIIVMGSTNRLDFVDPALRRPGRFDCELPIFLPTRNGRRDILQVHVSKWKDPPQVELLDELADRSVGFNGADLKFLCWQATMNSLRRTYPQIYGSSQKYLLNYDSIKMDREDWEDALASISPSTQRSLFSTYSPAQPLPGFVQPLLRKQLRVAVEFLEGLFPHDSPSLLAESSVKRLLLQAEGESGLNTFIVPALLHLLEKVPVYVLSFEALHMDGGNVEFCVTQKCMEVMKQPKPCICYLPDLERLCDLLSDASKEIMIRMMAQSLTKPILFLATVEGQLDHTFGENCDLSSLFVNHVVRLPRPSVSTIQLFFQPVFELATKVKRVVEAESRELEQLALAPPEDNSSVPKWTKEELEAIEKRENSTFRELRIFLRQILTKLARNKKFEEFTCPVDIEEVPDYLEVIERPMDFEAMMFKLNSNSYYTARQFLDDIDLIYTNCLAYNPHKTESDKRLRLRAYELKDFAEKLIEDEMDSDFERECHKIIKARGKRNKTTSGGNSNANPESSNGQVKELAVVSSSSTNVVTPSTSTRNRVDPSTSSTSRPASAKTKRRKSSAWSKGTIQKKKCKRPNSSSVRNLEDKNFSQIVIEEEKGEDDEDDEDEEVDVVGDDDETISPTVETTESSSSAAGKLRAVPRLSQSSSSSTSPPGSGGTVPNSSSPGAATPNGPCDNDFYPCNNAATFGPKFDHLLTKTVHQCQNLSVVKLIDLRFQVLRLVTKHLSSPDKTALYGEVKAWLKKISPSLTASPSSASFVTTTTTSSSFTPRHLQRPFNAVGEKVPRLW